MNQKLMEQFKVETGLDAKYNINGAIDYTMKYVKWLEGKVLESEWISVEERLPQFGQIVDVITEELEYNLVKRRFSDVVYVGGKFMLHSLEVEIIKITHWRPIPESPK